MTTPYRRLRCKGITGAGLPCGNTVGRGDTSCGACLSSRASDVLGVDDVDRLKRFIAQHREGLSHPRRRVFAHEPMTPTPRTPADRLAAFARQNPALAKTAQSAANYVDRAVQPSTRLSYKYAFDDYCTFAKAVDLIALPGEPETVVLYLTEMSDRCGRAGKPLAHATVLKAVQAISFEHRCHELPDPTKDDFVRRWIEGHARVRGVAPEPKDPLLLDDLEQIVVAAEKATSVSLRNAAIVLAATQPDNDLSAARIASLRSPSQVEILDGGKSAVLWVGCGTSARRQVQVEIFAEDDPMICPVRAFAALLDAHERPGPLLANDVDGRQLTRQGVRKIIRRATSVTSGHEDVDGVPKLPRAARRDLASFLYGASAETLRDIALLLSVYWTARRGADVPRLVMVHVEVLDEGVIWHIGRTKTDPTGLGYTVGAPVCDDEPLLCPLRALKAWLERYRLLLGREFQADDPVFPRLDRAGYLRSPIGREAVSAIVQRRAAAAGLKGSYGAHSPRSGFVTDAINNDVPSLKIAKQGGWASVESLDRYYRRTGTFGVTNPAIDIQRRRRKEAQPIDPPDARDGPDGQDETDASDEAEAS